MKNKLFISYASEDKHLVVEPLISRLKEHGVDIWYDDYDIEFGDNIKTSIKNGLDNSRYGIVILSQHFLNKDWPKMELKELLEKESYGKKVVLPILHNIEVSEVTKIIPTFSEKAYEKTEIKSGRVVNLKHILKKIIKVLLNYEFASSQEMALIDILEKCKSSENTALFTIGELLDKYYRIRDTDIEMAIIRANMILDYILKDLCSKNLSNQNVGISNLLELCCSKGLLGKNIETHCNIIKSFSEIVVKKPESLDTISGDDFNSCQNSIRAILNWYIETYGRAKLLCKNDLSIVWPEDFTLEDIKESYIIETKLFNPDLISPIEVIMDWAEHNPYINIGVRDVVNGRLVGFFCVLPITNTLFEEIALGKYIDTYIPISEIRTYDPPDFYKLYLCSFCIDPDYQNTKAFKLLSNAFIDLLLKFADQEIFISEMIADAITDKGERLCKHIDMKVINTTNHRSKIYKTTLLPPALRTVSPNAVKLEKFYSDLYNKYKDIL